MWDRNFFPTIVRIYCLGTYFNLSALQQRCLKAVNDFDKALEAYHKRDPLIDERVRMVPIVEGFAEAVDKLYTYRGELGHGCWGPDMDREMRHFARRHAWAFGRSRDPNARQGIAAGIRIVEDRDEFLYGCEKSCSSCHGSGSSSPGRSD